MKYIVTKEPIWSTGGRNGRIVGSCIKVDEKGNEYEAVTDEKGVSWAAYRFEKLDGLELCSPENNEVS